MAIRCNHDHEIEEDPGAWARVASAQPLVREWVLDREHAVPCAHWPAVAIPTQENGRVASAIPAILLVGAFDPATPPRNAEFAAATLKRADLYRFPASGHGVLGSDRCASLITGAFLDDPDTRPSAACPNAPRSVDFSPTFQMRTLSLMAHHRPAEAERILEQTLGYQDERLRPDDPDIGVTLTELGEL